VYVEVPPVTVPVEMYSVLFGLQAPWPGEDVLGAETMVV
jgi:hypothetical protein